MAWCPFAIRSPIPENATQGRIDPHTLIFHTAVDAPGRTDLKNWFNSPGCELESHFFVQNDGTIIQYIDTTVRADANAYANTYALSVETEDDGRPDLNPWTPAQVKALIKLGNWCRSAHPRIAKKVCTSPTSGGLGWHAMWGAPSVWTPARGKVCPGALRIAQLKSKIFPAIIAGVTPAPVEDDMPSYQSMSHSFDPGASGDKARHAVIIPSVVRSGTVAKAYAHVSADWVPDREHMSVVGIGGYDMFTGKTLFYKEVALFNGDVEEIKLPTNTNKVRCQVISSGTGAVVTYHVEVHWK